MQVERYRIILTGWVMSGRQTGEVAKELSRLFKIPESRVRPLLEGSPSIIRRDLTLEKAEHLRNKIEQRGAVCSLKKVVRDEAQLRPYNLDSSGFLEPDLNMESTQFIMTGKFQGAVTPPPNMYGPRKIKIKRQKRGTRLPTLLLVLVVSAALAWGLFQLYVDRTDTKATQGVFTFSPAKDETKGEETKGSIQR